MVTNSEEACQTARQLSHAATTLTSGQEVVDEMTKHLAGGEALAKGLLLQRLDLPAREQKRDFDDIVVQHSARRRLAGIVRKERSWTHRLSLIKETGLLATQK